MSSPRRRVHRSTYKRNTAHRNQRRRNQRWRKPNQSRRNDEENNRHHQRQFENHFVVRRFWIPWIAHRDSSHVLVAIGSMDGNWIQMARHLFGHWWWIVSILFGGHSRFALPLLFNNRGDVRGDFNRWTISNEWVDVRSTIPIWLANYCIRRNR